MIGLFVVHKFSLNFDLIPACLSPPFNRIPFKVHQLDLQTGHSGNRTGKFRGNSTGCEGVTALEFIEFPPTTSSTSSSKLVVLAVTTAYPTATPSPGEVNNNAI